MKALLNRAQPLVLALVAAAAFVACDEQLDSGMACPTLCPQQNTSIRDTTIFAVDLDTSIAGFPALGAELELFIASIGDTLDTRGIVRYDTLPSTFRHVNSTEDSVITAIDTGAMVKFFVVNPDTAGAPVAGDPPVTVEIYDVELGGEDDTNPLAVDTAFTPDRLIGSRTFAADSVRDSLTVPIDPVRLLQRIQGNPATSRLRLGFRVTSTGKARMTMVTQNGAAVHGVRPPALIFRPAQDSTVELITWYPRSKTPSDLLIAGDLADYLVVVKAPPDPPPNVLRVGGIPGRRAYFRFNIPPSILDSSSIVRATLLLTQRPNSFAPDANDTTAIQQFAVTSGPTVTDVARALVFLSLSRPDSVYVVSADSGQRAVEIIGVVRAWRATTVARTPRALALASAKEGRSPRQADFFSTGAPLDVRPRLHLFYLPRQPAGIP